MLALDSVLADSQLDLVDLEREMLLGLADWDRLLVAVRSQTQDGLASQDPH